MIFHININSKKFKVDFSSPLDISLPLVNGESNPNCYNADPVRFQTISSGAFVGSVKQGGSVNYQKVTMTPHGNGTHTECYGHISEDESITINSCLVNFHFLSQLITIGPKLNSDGDQVIGVNDLSRHVLQQNVKAIVIRTLPNGVEKKLAKYSSSNPPYIDKEVTDMLVDRGIEHLLVDLPSIDREVDGGALKAHKSFWKYPNSPRKQATITELIYVPEFIQDGLYLLNLQITSLEMDASPSKPILYKLEEVS
jgi:kynurenine formamidase